jgi:uncharacterized membrane protein YgcG
MRLSSLIINCENSQKSVPWYTYYVKPLESILLRILCCLGLQHPTLPEVSGKVSKVLSIVALYSFEIFLCCLGLQHPALPEAYTNLFSQKFSKISALVYVLYKAATERTFETLPETYTHLLCQHQRPHQRLERGGERGKGGWREGGGGRRGGGKGGGGERERGREREAVHRQTVQGVGFRV